MSSCVGRCGCSNTCVLVAMHVRTIGPTMATSQWANGRSWWFPTLIDMTLVERVMSRSLLPLNPPVSSYTYRQPAVCY